MKLSTWFHRLKEISVSNDLFGQTNVLFLFVFSITVFRRPVWVYWVTSAAVEDSGCRTQTGTGPETPLCPHLLHPLFRATGDAHAGQR